MAKTIDPVCGMTVETGKAADQADFGDTTYFFCSKHCGERFRASPEKFLAKTAVESRGWELLRWEKQLLWRAAASSRNLVDHTRYGCCLHLSDAPRSATSGAGQLS